jgi:hypothetical protein
MMPFSFSKEEVHMSVVKYGFIGGAFGAGLGGAFGSLPAAITCAQIGAWMGLKLGAAQQGVDAIEQVGRQVVDRALRTVDIWEKFLRGGAAVSGSCWTGLELFKSLGQRCLPIVWAEAVPCAAMSAASTVFVGIGTWYGVQVIRLAANRFTHRA